jgi:twitching motility protein PilT
MAFDLEAALKRVIETGGSDLHLKVPSPPLIRIHGKLTPIPDADKLMPNDTEDVFNQMVTDEGKREEFQRERELDFSFGMQGAGRFRVNAFHQRGSISFVFRAIPSDIKTVEELNLPPAINDLADEERGIILVTGTTGSGKSTTLAAMIDRMNTHHYKHIVTIEDPIEFLHRDKNSIINQREVGQDTLSFKAALKRVLRQDPDTILVLSTLHTVDAPESINRIIDFFEPHMQPQARAMLAGTLKGVISQRLARTADGQGRVAVCEVLKATARIKDMIMDPDMTGNIPEAIAEGAYYGMQTFDQALLGHVGSGRVSMDEALKAATSPHDFKLMVAADGQRSTSVEQLMATEV